MMKMKKLFQVAVIGVLIGLLFLPGCGKQRKPAELPVESAALPDALWQKDVTFPDWKGYVDNSLAMNGMISFLGYHGQGMIYITPEESVTSFRMFLNDKEVDTSLMTGGQTWAVDLAEVSLDGLNTLQFSEIDPYEPVSGIRVSIPYPEVLPGTLEEEGISPESLTLISDIVEADIAEGFPSAQLAVIRNGRLIYENAWGSNTDTLYDLASVTKMFSVNYALQKLVTDGKVSLDDKVSDYIGARFYESEPEQRLIGDVEAERQAELKQSLTLRDLLQHRSGYSDDPRYYNPVLDIKKPADDPENANPLYAGSDGSEESKEKTIDAICRTPLRYEPRTATVYSDLNYILLGVVVEEITGTDLNTYLKEEFWKPMGLTHITYEPLENGFQPENCAPTEPNGNTRDGNVTFPGVRTETVQGEVHDELAYYNMGGISGHAGLFSNATDLAKLASVMFSGGYGENRFFSRNVMDNFMSPKYEDTAKWGLGWYREGDDERVWYFGTQSDPNTIGHQGWTGTMVMIDPSRELVVVFLTNKVNTPVTDPEENLNKFDGNYYTTSTLGFVPQILSVGMDCDRDVTQTLAALTADMATEASRLIDETVPADHPLYKNLSARIAVLRKWAEQSKDPDSKKRIELADSLTRKFFPDVTGN